MGQQVRSRRPQGPLGRWRVIGGEIDDLGPGPLGLLDDRRARVAGAHETRVDPQANPAPGDDRRLQHTHRAVLFLLQASVE